MIDVLIKGLGVGVAVAAPVGPIGVLCIKRTLASGKSLGLATGLGAASADAVYGFMVAAGMSLTGLLVSYAKPLELFGGLMIALLGLSSIRTFLANKFNEANVPNPQDKKVKGLLTAFISTFILTLSNPMTILAFIALVTGLSASATSQAYAAYLLVLGVFLGSSLWWFFLVAVSSRLTASMTSGTVRWLDLASGTILILWGLWIFVGAMQTLD